MKMDISALRRGLGLCRSAAGLLKSRTFCSFGDRISEKVARSPCLLMPSPISDESGKVAFKFHRLGNKQPMSCDKFQLPDKLDLDKVYIAGSSHGWLFVHNWMNRDLYMLNPITGRHIKLPSVRAAGGVSRVALSCSPDKDECRAMIIFGGRARRLAFCVPGRSTEWTPIGGERKYEDVVYSSIHKLFFCITMDPSQVERWNIAEDWSLRINEHLIDLLFFDDGEYAWPCRSYDEAELKQVSWRIKYILVHDDDLFLVVRHVNPRMRAHDIDMDESSVVAKPLYISKYRGWDASHPYRTFDFDVYQIDWRGRSDVRYMKCSLEGLAMFVGNNHSFAMAADDEFKPNCIYFSDDNSLMRKSISFADSRFGGHDNGIFDYQNNTFAECCDGCLLNPVEYDDIKRIEHPPLWLTPPTLTH